jgi:hypothetical protein
MSLVRKSNPDTADRQLLMLPDLPVLDGLSKAGQTSFADWWNRVREALKREDDILRALIGGVRDSIPTQATETPGSTIVNIDGSGGVSREEVEQIVSDSISNAIANARYTHSQGVPSTEWLIVHNLGWKPSATVIDSVGNEVCGDVKHDSITQLRISFTNAFSGNAYLT